MTSVFDFFSDISFKFIFLKKISKLICFFNYYFHTELKLLLRNPIHRITKRKIKKPKKEEKF